MPEAYFACRSQISSGAASLPTTCTARNEAMIKVKHFLERIEADDGPRLWVEGIGLTKDFQAWREVHHVLPHLGPPCDVSDRLVAHPDEYENFRRLYHEWLSNSPFWPAMQWLACDSLRANFTLL